MKSAWYLLYIVEEMYEDWKEVSNPSSIISWQRIVVLYVLPFDVN